MSPHIPITLAGENLGKRHRELNNVVSEALKLGEPIEKVLELPEKTAIDRLFKIDLASKQKHVGYILKNLKEDDMLYVSRALKSKWLLDEHYKDIINPLKLESDVYPEMIVPAVNKMRHWIHLNLRDENRCQEFYQYYREIDRKLAMKYLLKCPTDLITKELMFFFKHDSAYFYGPPQYYITPHYFKMFCERTPLVAKHVYNLIDKDKSFRLSYMNQQYEYFESLKCVLKSDPDIFLDIVEKHFNVNQFDKLNSVATRFILTHKKDRFLKKPELYAAWLLDVKELAKCLTGKECEELVIQLARAKFLDPWFNYKNVEPLIKRLDSNKRAEFKRRVFVRKEIGEDVKDWPYPRPGPGAKDEALICDDSVSDEYDACNEKLLNCVGMSSNCERRKLKSYLDCLFDEYRFKSFTEALFELSKKVSAESIPRNRMHMMLVLISKSGGKEANLEALFQFLMKHRNEPPQVRAAIIRSLVRRASIWRVSDEMWVNLIKFGEGLGLDGGTAEVECKEGLHAVVIRSLMKTDRLPAKIKPAFLNMFSPLITEYTLSKTEKSRILYILPNLLLDAINTETNGDRAAYIMDHLLDTLELTDIQVDTYDNVIITVKKFLERNQTCGKRVLMRFFNCNIGRKELLKENFDMIQNDDSYVNALKHDTGVLSSDKLVKSIVSDNLALNRFLRKMNVYFAEDGGLASRLLIEMKNVKTNKNLARPIAYLIGNDLKTYILEIDDKRNGCKDEKEIEKFCAEIRANAHLARPLFNLDSFTWRQAGVKLVANRVLVCRSVDVDRYIVQSLSWKRTARLATVLAKRSDCCVEVLTSVATMRPKVAIKVAIEHFKRDQSTVCIWKMIKPLVLSLDPENTNLHLIQKLENFNQIPESIRPEFIQDVFPLYVNTVQHDVKLLSTQKLLINRVLQQVHKLLPRMNPEFVDELLLSFLAEQFNPDKRSKLEHSPHSKVGVYTEADMYVRILAKYLILCKNENEQNERFAYLGDMFLDAMGIYWQKSCNRNTYLHYINLFLQALKSNSIYFSNEYISCAPVMAKVVNKIHSQLPIDEYFKFYVEVHLNMLYYFAVKQGISKRPKVFAGEAKDQKRNLRGMMIIAEIFGRYVARDARNLTAKYFDSIPELYSKTVKDYFYRFREARHALSLPFVKGIIQASKGFVGRLAVDLYNEYQQNDENWDKIREFMARKFDNNMMFFYYNDIIANPLTREEW